MGRTERGIGLELIQWRTAMVIASGINDELEAQEDFWTNRDFEWAAQMNQEPSSVSLEYIYEENIYRGHRPSIILENFPKEKFPNISVMAYEGRPTVDIIDQATNFDLNIDIECFVKADSEAECDARTHRTTEAIHQVLLYNESLNSYTYGWDNEPTVIITDIFLKNSVPEEDTWFYQGSRLRYKLTRHARLPSNY